MYQSHIKGRAAANKAGVIAHDQDDEVGDGPDSGTDMSVFSDFTSAWQQRFPGCELPKAWEEDVRGNLSKHRQQVTMLKEEIEKEEFYVEYLETLLANVERVRKPSIASPDRTASPSVNSEVRESTVTKESNGDQYVTVISVSSYGEIEKKGKKPKPAPRDEQPTPLIDNPLYQDTLPVTNDKSWVCYFFLNILLIHCIPLLPLFLYTCYHLTQCVCVSVH